MSEERGKYEAHDNWRVEKHGFVFLLCKGEKGSEIILRVSGDAFQDNEAKQEFAENLAATLNQFPGADVPCETSSWRILSKGANGWGSTEEAAYLLGKKRKEEELRGILGL